MSRRRFEVPEAAWDAWAVTKHIDGEATPATEQELLQRGLVVLARAEGVVHVMGLLIDNSPDGKRYAALGLPVEGEKLPAVPAKAWKRLREALPPEAKGQAFKSDVVRGSGLVEAATDEITGDHGRSRSTEDVELAPRAKHDEDTIARARELAADPEHPAQKLRVSMAEIEEGDVVIATDLPPFSIQGEPKR